MCKNEKMSGTLPECVKGEGRLLGGYWKKKKVRRKNSYLGIDRGPNKGIRAKTLPKWGGKTTKTKKKNGDKYREEIVRNPERGSPWSMTGESLGGRVGRAGRKFLEKGGSLTTSQRAERRVLEGRKGEGTAWGKSKKENTKETSQKRRGGRERLKKKKKKKV